MEGGRRRWAELEAAGAGPGPGSGQLKRPGDPLLAAACAALAPGAGGEGDPGARARAGAAAKVLRSAAAQRCAELRRAAGERGGDGSGEPWAVFFGDAVAHLAAQARLRGARGPTRLAVVSADAAFAASLALVEEAALSEATRAGPASAEWMSDRFDAASNAAAQLQAVAPMLAALIGLIREWALAGGGAVGARRALLAQALSVARQRVGRLGEERGADEGVRQALLMCWVRWAPLLLTDGAGFARCAALSLSDCECRLLAAESQLDHAAGDPSGEEGRGAGEEAVRISAAVREYRVLSLVSLGLRLSKFSDDRAGEAAEGPEGETSRRQQVARGVLSALRSGELPRPAMTLAGVVFRRLAIGDDALPDVEAAEGLLRLLDERDFAAAAVTPLLAEAAAADASGRVFEAVLQRLGPGNPLPAQQCALDVAEQLLLLKEEPGTSTKEGEDREVAPTPSLASVEESLVAALLHTLGDANLAARLQASRIFALLSPTPTFLRALVEKMGSREPRVYSAAADALLSSLEGHPSSFQGLLRTVAELPRPELCGSEEGAEAQDNSAGREDGAVRRGLSKMGRVLERWAEKLGGQLPEGRARELTRAVLAHPGCAELVGLATSGSACCLGPHAGAVFAELCAVLGSGEPAGETDEPAEDMRVFERLSPLLILKVLPLEAFNDDGTGLLYRPSAATESARIACAHKGVETRGDIDSDSGIGVCISAFVSKCAAGVAEVEAVRRAAAEVFGRFRPEIALPDLSDALARSSTGGEGGEALPVARSCLFSICHNFLSYGFICSGVSERASASRTICGTVLTILEGLMRRPELSEGQVKLRLGCVDCLSTAIFTELHFSSTPDVSAAAGPCGERRAEDLVLPEGQRRPGVNAGPLIVEIEPGTAAPELLDLFVRAACGEGQEGLARLIGRTTTANAGVVGRLEQALCHVIIIACQRLQTASSKRSMALHAFPALLRAAGADRPVRVQSNAEPSDAALRCAQLQVLYTSFHHLGGDNVLPFAEETMTLAISFLRRPPLEAQPDLVHLEAAKLLTAVLAGSDGVLEACSHLLVDARRVVSAVASGETPGSSPALRAICSQLLSCMAQ